MTWLTSASTKWSLRLGPRRLVVGSAEFALAAWDGLLDLVVAVVGRARVGSYGTELARTTNLKYITDLPSAQAA